MPKPAELMLREFYLARKLSINAIARMTGWCNITISRYLKKYSIPLRTPSEQMEGRSVTWGSKIGAAQKGRKLTPKVKAKMSAARLGMPAWNKGLRKATHAALKGCGNPGDKHWNWKGGISGKGSRFRQTSEYKAWRDAVYKRDNFTCVFCGKRGGVLNAHHIIPLAGILKSPQHIIDELALCVHNGYTLCGDCHKSLHRS